MGNRFTITDAMKAQIQQAFDDVVTELGRPCRVVYPPQWAPCVNCVSDPIGRKSANRWRTGGPVPFSNGTTCPLCKGAGGHNAPPATADVELKIEWDRGRFWVPVPQSAIKGSLTTCQAKGLASELPKLTGADHLLVHLPVAPFSLHKFVLAGGPWFPHSIVQGRYAVTQWEARG